MSEANIKLTEENLSLFPIRTVSDLTGVNAITLRAWERRYGLLEPVRKESGHRLYTQEHIDLVNRVVGLLDHGMRIGQVKQHLDREQTAGVQGDSWQRYQNHMIASVIRFDEAGLEETYAQALALHPVEMVTERLLNPMLKELGRRWAAGEGGVSEEHFFAFYLRNKLGARFHHRSRKGRGPRLLLACLPGDRHETGLLFFALAASEAGFQTILLGADMPLDELAAAAAKADCQAVVLSGFMDPDAAIIEQGLVQLVQEAAVPVFVGGRASLAAADSIRRAGAEPLGTDLGTGIARLESMLGGGQ